MEVCDLHVHTVWSDGKNTMEEQVEQALARGFAAIGFSDHSYTDFDLRYCMKPEQEEGYHREITRLKRAYEGRIEVYAGLEYDGYTDLTGRERYDYLIGDCHYIKTADGYFSVDHAKDEQWAAIRDQFGGDALAYARAYFDTYVARTCLHRPDILGHFDLCAKFGFMPEESPAYRDLAAQALLACLEVTPIVELNTGAIARGARTLPYPAPYLWTLLREHRGKLILSSDAHQRENLGFWFGQAVQQLKAAGFDSMILLRKGQFEEIGL